MEGKSPVSWYGSSIIYDQQDDQHALKCLVEIAFQVMIRRQHKPHNYGQHRVDD